MKQLFPPFKFYGGLPSRGAGHLAIPARPVRRAFQAEGHALRVVRPHTTNRASGLPAAKAGFPLLSLAGQQCHRNVVTKYFILLAAIAFACTANPEPLSYGTDACHACKMTLMDNKFGAEIVTKKGKVYKFDDLNCMINFYNSGYEPEDNMAYKLVIDFANPGQFIDATQNYYVKSDSIRTPMASGVAAFSNEKDFKSYKKKWKGILLSWGELTTEFK